MTLIRLWQPYPTKRIEAVSFTSNLPALFERPLGLDDSLWPPTQMVYLGRYLNALGCKTIVIESHYIDRDYISDVALFYSRSLRAYDNFCQRLHFFKEPFDQSRWTQLVAGTSGEESDRNVRFLQGAYLGFSVLRPLPGSPVGRTVLPPLGLTTATGRRREFQTIRDYKVHLARFELRVRGLAFQQQDQGVSACATTALWSSIHGVAPVEGLSIPTPADITEAASRYLLVGGRPLPSEGLTVHQMCEAIRATGLAPLFVPSISYESDRAQLYSYLRSGLAPVLAIQSLEGAGGHAVCAVGFKSGEVAPQTDPKLNFRDASTSLQGLYIHDDRLGPYASADVYAWTLQNKDIRTALRISWPDEDVDVEHAVLSSFVVPVPTKLRLTVTRMRELGLRLADTAGQIYQQFNRTVTLATKYQKGSAYQSESSGFGLSADGIYKLCCGIALSRYVGVIEIGIPDGPLFDLVLDATETNANPAALVCVRREMLPAENEEGLRSIVASFGAEFIK
jgi:hypothetical protein